VIDAQARGKAIADVSTLGVSGSVRGMSSNGVAITPEKRDELLAAVRDGKHVELLLHLRAFEQKPGVRNRKGVRFRDGALMAFGRSGKGMPFLRDHAQGNLLARGGTILDSKTEKLGEGDYGIDQDVQLTAPWAVDAALRGLLDGVSVGIFPTGPVLCSGCGTEVLDACFHFPGDTISTDDEVEHVVEWVYTSADLVETSAVNVPAVPTAHIEGIRAALSAQQPDNPITRNHMNPKLLLALSLAATAGEPEVLSAVEALKRERDSARAELGVANAELDIVRKDYGVLAAEKRKFEEDDFITKEIQRGALHLGMEETTRELFRVNPTKCRELAAKRPDGSITPVSAPRQSAKEPEAGLKPPAAGANLEAHVKTELGKHGVNGEEVLRLARMFGAKNPEKTLAAELGVKEV